MVFALGAALAGLAGALVGALQSVQVGMGEPVLILAFVVIVIGGIGSIKGALVGAMLVGLIDTLGRFLLPKLFACRSVPRQGATVGAALASMLIYIVMALILAFRPQGPVRGEHMSTDDPRNDRSTCCWRRCCSPLPLLAHWRLASRSTSRSRRAWRCWRWRPSASISHWVSADWCRSATPPSSASAVTPPASFPPMRINMTPFFTWPFEIGGIGPDACDLAGGDC